MDGGRQKYRGVLCVHVGAGLKPAPTVNNGSESALEPQCWCMRFHISGLDRSSAAQHPVGR